MSECGLGVAAFRNPPLEYGSSAQISGWSVERQRLGNLFVDGNRRIVTNGIS